MDAEPATTAVVSVGAITGFGSVIVNGVRFDDRLAVVTVNDQPATPAQLKVGMVVQIEGGVRPCSNAGASLCEGVAARIRFRNDIEGPVTQINRLTHTLQVMGREVVVDDLTVFDGTTATELAGLSVGDLVSVSGLQEQARLRARLIQRSGAFQEGTSAVMAHGLVANLNNTLGTCTVDGVQVRFRGLPAADLPLNGVANGQFVTVHARSYSDGLMAADRIQLRDRISYPDSGLVALEGDVSGYVSVSNFKVGGQQVDAATATFIHGGATDLKDGLLVQVEGTIAGGVLAASRVVFRQEVSAQIVAPIQSKNSAAGSFVLLGQAVATTPWTLFLDSSGRGGRAMTTWAYADLAVADRVDVRTFRDSAGKLVATRVERTAPDATLIVRAKVEAKAPTTAFKLVGIDVSTGPSTRYRDALSNLISADEFYALLQVPPAAPTMVRAQGVASAVSPSTVDATRTNDTRGEVEVAQ